MPPRNPGHPFILPGSLPFWKGAAPVKKKPEIPGQAFFWKGNRAVRPGLRGNPESGDSPQSPHGSLTGPRTTRTRSLSEHRGREDFGQEREKEAGPEEVLRIPAPSLDQGRREAGKRPRGQGQAPPPRISRAPGSGNAQAKGDRAGHRSGKAVNKENADHRHSFRVFRNGAPYRWTCFPVPKGLWPKKPGRRPPEGPKGSWRWS